MYALKMNTDGYYETVDFPENESEILPFLQKHVDGWVEHVAVEIHGREYSMWINEEGLLKGLPYNGAATYLYNTSWAAYGDSQIIVGDALITKGNSLGATLPLLMADVMEVRAGLADYEALRSA